VDSRFTVADEINRVFGNVMMGEQQCYRRLDAGGGYQRIWDRFELLVDVPEWTQQVEITLDNSVLTLSGERRDEQR